jgi:hypothetical protein
MSDNPYAPPKSNVEDAVSPQTPMARPSQIVTAIWLAMIGYALGMIVIFLEWDYYSKLQTIGAFVWSQMFSLSLLIWIYYKIYVGRNWARITLLVLSVFGSLISLSRAVMELLATAPTIAKVEMFVALALNGTILWLLFFSPGRYWFRRPSGGTVA